MVEQTLPLTTFYSGWSSYQQGLVEMIAPLTPEQLATPASAHHWPIGMILQHMLADRVFWYQVWMGAGSPDLASILQWDPSEKDARVHTAAELTAALTSTWQMIADALAHWTPADLEQVISPPAALSEAEKKRFGDLSRQWIIWHVLEHEINHGGEISLALGAIGLPGVYGNL
jgi:uncharacterized damage-inducible protein DinB